MLINLEEKNLTCMYCGGKYSHLGSHLWHKHKVKARDYKEDFGLDFKYPLISEEVKQKKHDRFEERREYYLSNLRSQGKKWYFKKGHTNRQRFSEQSLERARQNLEWIEEHKSGNCPVCKIGFEHLTSHLYNKHGLVFAQK